VSGDEHSLYVYGAVRASELPDLDVTGVGGESAALKTIARAEVAAVVSEVEDGPLSAARDLRAHWRVLEEVASRTTVVPVRFGTVVAGEEALIRDFLDPEGERLAALLAELRGKVQLNVKCFYDEERLLTEVVSGSPGVARLRERVQGLPEAAGYYDRIRLGELVSAEIEQRRERDGALVLDRLAPLAVAAKNDAPGTTDMAVNAAFLVESARVDEFSSQVAKLTDELGSRMRVRYVGPMPAYSFADAEVAAGSPAWA